MLVKQQLCCYSFPVAAVQHQTAAILLQQRSHLLVCLLSFCLLLLLLLLLVSGRRHKLQPFDGGPEHAEGPAECSSAGEGLGQVT